MSKVRPILFNTEMVRAILDGRKTVTRRCVKARSKNACGFYVTFRKSDNAFMGVYDYDENERQFDSSQTPPCQPGDILYVRETYMDYSGLNMYKADCNKYRLKSLKLSGFSWRPSIHMPKEAARIWLKVTDVRVERLQDITIIQAIAEGILPEDVIPMVPALPNYPEYDMDQIVGDMQEAEQIRLIAESFGRLWDSTIKKPDLDRYGWEANPWVFVIEFEQCEKPEGWPG